MAVFWYQRRWKAKKAAYKNENSIFALVCVFTFSHARPVPINSISSNNAGRSFEEHPIALQRRWPHPDFSAEARSKPNRTVSPFFWAHKELASDDSDLHESSRETNRARQERSTEDIPELEKRDRKAFWAHTRSAEDISDLERREKDAIWRNERSAEDIPDLEKRSKNPFWAHQEKRENGALWRYERSAEDISDLEKRSKNPFWAHQEKRDKVAFWGHTDATSDLEKRQDRPGI